MAILSTKEYFDIAHEHVAYWERDFDEITNHPTDPGGPTKNGISLKYLKSINEDLNKDGKIDIEDIKTVNIETARRLLHNSFWNVGKAAMLPPLTSIVYYDCAVTAGSGRAATIVQKAIDKIWPGTIVKYAPNIGPKTQAACEKIVKENKDYELALQVDQGRRGFYTYLANNKPGTYGAFLKGWLNRCDACIKLVEDIHKRGIQVDMVSKIKKGYK